MAKSPRPSLDKAPERIAKVIARSGLCSRREAETFILAGRVRLNGRVLDTPAQTVTADDRIEVDGEQLREAERTRVWLFNKPKAVLVAAHDPQDRTVLRDVLPSALRQVHPVGRLDFNTEGLLLLTNDGALKRVLELPSTGWLRRYRVRAFGHVTEERLASLREGVTIDGIRYGAMQIDLERQQGDNQWLTVGLREGKNREVKVVLAHIGLQVNRLIRTSYGPFQLGDLPAGEVKEIRTKVLKDQLAGKVFQSIGLNFEGPLHGEPQDLSRKAVAKPVKRVRRTPASASTSRKPAGGQAKAAKQDGVPKRSPQRNRSADRPTRSRKGKR